MKLCRRASAAQWKSDGKISEKSKDPGLASLPAPVATLKELWLGNVLTYLVFFLEFV
jgi:hypothetical protein